MKKFDFKRFLVYFFLFIGAIIMIFPFYWMIISALKNNADFMAYPPKWVPSSWLNFENFKTVFTKAPFLRYFFNSVLVTICCVTLCSFTTIMGAFAFSRLKFPGRDIIFSLL